MYDNMVFSFTFYANLCTQKSVYLQSIYSQMFIPSITTTCTSTSNATASNNNTTKYY